MRCLRRPALGRPAEITPLWTDRLAAAPISPSVGPSDRGVLRGDTLWPANARTIGCSTGECGSISQDDGASPIDHTRTSVEAPGRIEQAHELPAHRCESANWCTCSPRAPLARSCLRSATKAVWRAVRKHAGGDRRSLARSTRRVARPAAYGMRWISWPNIALRRTLAYTRYVAFLQYSYGMCWIPSRSTVTSQRRLVTGGCSPGSSVPSQYTFPP